MSAVSGTVSGRALQCGVMSRLTTFIAGAVSVAVVVGILALSGVFDDGGATAHDSAATATSTPAATTTTAATPATSSGAVDVASIYRRVSPGVVFVEADQAGGQSASGSGFVIDGQGHIVTNEHVVDGASALKVRFGENGDAIPVKLLGADRSADLAVLRVDPKRAGTLHPVTLGSSSNLVPGEPTVAIGSPFGLEGTVTSGIVSGLNRTIQAPSGFSISGAVQTDAAINPGNSGGPLLDAQGRVIGVNSQIATQSGSNAGVGFAIPVDQVKKIVPVLERGQKVQHAFLGVASGNAPAGGAQVGSVVRGGPADKAGLRAGDRILQIGGQAVHDSGDLSASVNSHQPGEKVPVVVERGGQRRTLTVTLGTQPQQASGGGPTIP
jgi:putative serine protease PepD